MTEKTANLHKYSADWMTKAFRAGKLALGDVAGAVTKLKLKPRKLMTLGRGMEGSASLFTDPTHGKAVWKFNSPFSPFFSPQGFNRKVRTWKSLRRNPYYAKYYGNVGDTAITKHEYIPGESFSPLTSFPKKYKYKAVLIPSIKNKIMGRGNINDVLGNVGNYKIVNGKPKIIDFLTPKTIAGSDAGVIEGSLRKSLRTPIFGRHGSKSDMDRMRLTLKHLSVRDKLMDAGQTAMKNIPTEGAAYNYSIKRKALSPEFAKKFKPQMDALNVKRNKAFDMLQNGFSDIPGMPVGFPL